MVRHPLTLLGDPPDGVFVVVSSRDDLPFAVDPENQIEIRRNDSEHQEAVRSYIRVNTKRPPITAALKRARISSSKFEQDFMTKSEYNFMYLHCVLVELEEAGKRILAGVDDDSDSIGSLDPHRLPVGLKGYYRDHWNRLWKKGGKVLPPSRR